MQKNQQNVHQDGNTPLLHGSLMQTLMHHNMEDANFYFHKDQLISEPLSFTLMTVSQTELNGAL